MSDRVRLRLLLTPPASGPWNMAVDDHLLAGLEKDPSAGYLRFYRWSPPTLSFGRFQHPETIIDPERLSEAGIGAVRRASGGKMVFHADEWTFSLGLPVSSIRVSFPEARDFLGWFQAALSPLAETLVRLGVPAAFPDEKAGKRLRGREAHQAGIRQIHCYAAAAGHSLLAGGKKLVGAAGIERNGVFAIHGSLPVRPVPLPPDIFRRRPEIEGERDMAFLRDWLSEDGLQSLPLQVHEAMKGRFGLASREEQPLAPDEREWVERLAREKYADLFWPDRGSS